MSHPVWDEWIEMIWYRCKASIHNRSHPVWDEWIEISIFTMKKSKRQQSHPVWDEWIEIFLNGTNRYFVHGLIPFGMSGLKYWMCLSTWGRVGLIPFGMSGLKSIEDPSESIEQLSHPVWDEWIEIGTGQTSNTR